MSMIPCPRCGSSRVLTGSLGDRGARRCMACGSTWRELGDVDDDTQDRHR